MCGRVVVVVVVVGGSGRDTTSADAGAQAFLSLRLCVTARALPWAELGAAGRDADLPIWVSHDPSTARSDPPSYYFV